ncbi:hypothetical protein AnigIFM50267_004295 [Aspergillus niger]|nr:hypothetical protein AnigIFM50267_004295 [Aspergillus niger]
MAHTLDDYTIAWICALPLEAAAARAMLDQTHILPERASDPNAYDFGELNGHHIVIVYCLLTERYLRDCLGGDCRVAYAFDLSSASVWTDGGNWGRGPEQKPRYSIG